MPRRKVLPAHRSARAASPAQLQVRAKVWIEAAGQVVLSSWRVELLEAIARTGSLAEAAQELRVPYRTAWYKLRDAETALGIQLVVGQSGGRQGGGSRLTAEAEDLIRRFRSITADVEGTVDRRFQEAFPAGQPPLRPTPPG